MNFTGFLSQEYPVAFFSAGEERSMWPLLQYFLGQMSTILTFTVPRAPLPVAHFPHGRPIFLKSPSLRAA